MKKFLFLSVLLNLVSVVQSAEGGLWNGYPLSSVMNEGKSYVRRKSADISNIPNELKKRLILKRKGKGVIEVEVPENFNKNAMQKFMASVLNIVSSVDYHPDDTKEFYNYSGNGIPAMYQVLKEKNKCYADNKVIFFIKQKNDVEKANSFIEFSNSIVSQRNNGVVKVNIQQNDINKIRQIIQYVFSLISYGDALSPERYSSLFAQSGEGDRFKKEAQWFLNNKEPLSLPVGVKTFVRDDKGQVIDSKHRTATLKFIWGSQNEQSKENQSIECLPFLSDAVKNIIEYHKNKDFDQFFNAIYQKNKQKSSSEIYTIFSELIPFLIKEKEDEKELLEKKLQEKMLAECPICFEAMKSDDELAQEIIQEDSAGKRVGGHIFHKECIDGWFAGKKDIQCPTCSEAWIPSENINIEDIFKI